MRLPTASIPKNHRKVSEGDSVLPQPVDTLGLDAAEVDEVRGSIVADGWLNGSSVRKFQRLGPVIARRPSFAPVGFVPVNTTILPIAADAALMACLASP